MNLLSWTIAVIGSFMTTSISKLVESDKTKRIFWLSILAASISPIILFIQLRQPYFASKTEIFSAELTEIQFSLIVLVFVLVFVSFFILAIFQQFLQNNWFKILKDWRSYFIFVALSVLWVSKEPHHILPLLLFFAFIRIFAFCCIVKKKNKEEISNKTGVKTNSYKEKFIKEFYEFKNNDFIKPIRFDFLISVIICLFIPVIVLHFTKPLLVNKGIYPPHTVEEVSAYFYSGSEEIEENKRFVKIPKGTILDDDIIESDLLIEEGYQLFQKSSGDGILILADVSDNDLVKVTLKTGTRLLLTSDNSNILATSENSINYQSSDTLIELTEDKDVYLLQDTQIKYGADDAMSQTPVIIALVTLFIIIWLFLVAPDSLNFSVVFIIWFFIFLFYLNSIKHMT